MCAAALTSRATGGDVLQGALTGATVHLFNHEAHIGEKGFDERFRERLEKYSGQAKDWLKNHLVGDLSFKGGWVLVGQIDIEIDSDLNVSEIYIGAGLGGGAAASAGGKFEFGDDPEGFTIKADLTAGAADVFSAETALAPVPTNFEAEVGAGFGGGIYGAVTLGWTFKLD